MNWKTIENPLFAFDSDDQFAKFHYGIATKTPPAELFHYTSGDSLLAILNSGCMFATERSFLNDPMEYEWGLRVCEDRLLNISSEGKYSINFIEQIRSALQEKQRDKLSLFVLSLSANPDLLSQWRAYAADGKGFAIGLDGKVLRDRSGFGEFLRHSIDLKTMPSGFIYCYHLLPVIYDRASQAAIVEAFIEAAHEYWRNTVTQDNLEAQTLFRLMVRHRIKELLISFKSEGYREEEEWRIVATTNMSNECIHYKNGKFGITPYVRLNLSSQRDLSNSRIPLSSLWVGPAAAEKRNPRGLEMLLQHRVGEAELKFSCLEYRA